MPLRQIGLRTGIEVFLGRKDQTQDYTLGATVEESQLRVALDDWRQLLAVPADNFGALR